MSSGQVAGEFAPAGGEGDIENPEARRVQELRLLFEISQILDRSLDLRDTVAPVVEAVGSFLDLKHVTITLFSRATGEILIEAAHGLSPKQAEMGRYRLGEGVTGQVVLTGKPAVIPKTSESPLFVNRTKRISNREFSFICVPIKAGKDIAGTLSADRLYNPESDLDEDVRLLAIIASMIAQAVKLRRSAQEERHRLETENERLRAELKDRFRPSNIIGNSREMQEVYNQIAQVSKSRSNVLLQGETGTGKELVAHAIHYNSDRADHPFVKVHCAALAENIIESELFGHVKGAYTGAINDRQGRFELANGGTLFLDEIGEVPPGIQIKLLRVLQEREFERVGGTKTIKVNVRLIAATNKNLQELVNRGEFREDLFYRLNVFSIYVPPLRKRKADIAMLSDYFLEKYSEQYGKNVKRLSSAVIDMLFSYHWPGNVRELENVIERAVVVAEGQVIHPYHMPPTLQTAEASGTVYRGDLKGAIELFERDLITDALKTTRGKIAPAARNLGTTSRILGYKIEKYGIDCKKYAT
jgi:Nif-specific regulatory protein